MQSKVKLHQIQQQLQIWSSLWVAEATGIEGNRLGGFHYFQDFQNLGWLQHTQKSSNASCPNFGENTFEKTLKVQRKDRIVRWEEA